MSRRRVIRTMGRKAAAVGAVAFMAVGSLGMVKVAYVVISADITARVSAELERERAQTPGVTTVASPDRVKGFTYDAQSDGTMLRLPDGTLIWVPLDRKDCPRVTVEGTLAGLCVTWADMGTDDLG